MNSQLSPPPTPSGAAIDGYDASGNQLLTRCSHVAATACCRCRCRLLLLPPAVFGQWHSQEMADELAYMRAPDLFFRPPCLADLDRIEAIEVTFFCLSFCMLSSTFKLPVLHSTLSGQSAGYPPDEAASRERLLYRLENGEQHSVGLRVVAGRLAPTRFSDSLPGLFGCIAAADQFLVAVKDDQIVGFICGTLTKADRLTEDSMGQHEPDGGASLHKGQECCVPTVRPNQLNVCCRVAGHPQRRGGCGTQAAASGDAPTAGVQGLCLLVHTLPDYFAADMQGAITELIQELRISDGRAFGCGARQGPLVRDEVGFGRCLPTPRCAMKCPADWQSAEHQLVALMCDVWKEPGASGYFGTLHRRK